MFESLKKSFGFVIGLYLGAAAVGVIRGILEEIAKTEESSKEEIEESE